MEKEWEYKITKHANCEFDFDDEKNSSLIQGYFNEFGSLGWELISVTQSNDVHSPFTAFFKREFKEEQIAELANVIADKPPQPIAKRNDIIVFDAIRNSIKIKTGIPYRVIKNRIYPLEKNKILVDAMEAYESKHYELKPNENIDWSDYYKYETEIILKNNLPYNQSIDLYISKGKSLKSKVINSDYAYRIIKTS